MLIPLLHIAALVAAVRQCDYGERSEYCPGFPDINPQQGTCVFDDNGTLDITPCSSYTCRPSEQVLHCGTYNLGCTIACENGVCSFLSGSCSSEGSPYPSVDGVMFCDDEKLTQNCRNPSVTQLSWTATCRKPIGEGLFKMYQGSHCELSPCSPPAMLDKCGAYSTECDTRMPECSQTRYQSARPIRRCTDREYLRSGAIFWGDCAVACQDEALTVGCRLLRQRSSADGWEEADLEWTDCSPDEHLSSCPECRTHMGRTQVKCIETPYWTDITERRNIKCPRMVARAYCDDENADCTQIGCDQYGKGCHTVICDAEACTPEEQLQLCGAYAPGCRKLRGVLDTCGVVTPGVPFDVSPLGPQCRRSGGADFCLLPWSVGQFVGPNRVPQYDGVQFRTCSAEESRKYCGEGWEEDDRRRPCKLLSCDRAGLNCTIVKGSCGCPSHSPLNGFPCGGPKTCDPPSEYCLEGATDCRLQCKGGLCHATECFCQYGRHPWPLGAVNCVGQEEEWANGCRRVGLRTSVMPSMDYLVCDSHPRIRGYANRTQVKGRPLATSRHLLQAQPSSDPMLIAACGVHVVDATVENGAVVNGSCVCEEGYYAGPSLPCERDYFVKPCADSSVPQELLSRCPGFKCLLRCYGPDNCTVHDDPLTCLNVTYNNISCPDYMSDYFCGINSTCRAGCSWGSDLSFTKRCDVWPELWALVNADSPYSPSADANGTVVYNEPQRVKEFLGTVCECKGGNLQQGFNFDVRPCGHNYTLKMRPISADPAKVISDCGAYASASIYRSRNGQLLEVDSCVCSGTYQPTISIEPTWSPFGDAKWATRITHCGGIIEEVGVCNAIETQCGPLTLGMLTIVNYTGETPRNALCVCRDGAVAATSGLDCDAFLRPCRLSEIREHKVCGNGTRSCTVRCDARGDNERCQIIGSTCSNRTLATRPCRDDERVGTCGPLSSSCDFDTLALEVIPESCTCLGSAVKDVAMRYGSVCASRHYTFAPCSDSEAESFCGELGRSGKDPSCRKQVVWFDLSMMLLVDETPRPEFPPPYIDYQIEHYYWDAGNDGGRGSAYVVDAAAGGFRLADGYGGSVAVEYPQCLCRRSPWQVTSSADEWRSTFDYRRYTWVTSSGQYGYIRCDYHIAEVHRRAGWCPATDNGLTCNGVGGCSESESEALDGMTGWEANERRAWWDGLWWGDLDYNFRSAASRSIKAYTPWSVPNAVPSQISLPIARTEGGRVSSRIPNWKADSYPFLINSRFYIRTSGRWPPVSLVGTLPGGQDSSYVLKAWSERGIQDNQDYAAYLELGAPFWTSPSDPFPGAKFRGKQIPSGVDFDRVSPLIVGMSTICPGSADRCNLPNVTDSPLAVFSIYADPRDQGQVVRIRSFDRHLVYDRAGDRLTFSKSLDQGSKWVPYSIDPRNPRIPSALAGLQPYITTFFNIDGNCFLTMDEVTHETKCRPGRPRSSWWALFSVPFQGTPAATVALVQQNSQSRILRDSIGGFSGGQPSSTSSDQGLFDLIPANDYNTEFLLLGVGGATVAGHGYFRGETRTLPTLDDGSNPECTLQLPKSEFFNNLAGSPSAEWVSSGRWTTAQAALYKSVPNPVSLDYVNKTLFTADGQLNYAPILSTYHVTVNYVQDEYNWKTQDDPYYFAVVGNRLRSCLYNQYQSCIFPWFSANAPSQQVLARKHKNYQYCLDGNSNVLPTTANWNPDQSVYRCGELQPCPTEAKIDNGYYYNDGLCDTPWSFVPVQFSQYQYDVSTHGRLPTSSNMPTVVYAPESLTPVIQNFQPIAAYYGLAHPLRPLKCRNCGPFLTGDACEIRNCGDLCEPQFRNTSCEGKGVGCVLHMTREEAYGRRDVECSRLGSMSWVTGSCTCDSQGLRPDRRCSEKDLDARNCFGRDCGAGNGCNQDKTCECKVDLTLVPESNCTQTNDTFYCNYQGQSCSGRGKCDGQGLCHTCMSGPNEYWSGSYCEVPNLRWGCVNGEVKTLGNSILCQCNPTWTGVACNVSLCPQVNGLPCSGAPNACHIDEQTGQASCTDWSLGRPRCSGQDANGNRNSDLAGCACQLRESELCGACSLAGNTANICKLKINESGDETLACDCPITTTGRFCETPTCGSCGPKGTCTSVNGKPQCVCATVGWPAVFSGPHCDVDVTEACGRVYAENSEILVCDSTTPGSRGTCVDTGNGTYACQCVGGNSVDRFCHDQRCPTRCPDRATCKEILSGRYQCVCDHPTVLSMDTATMTCTVNRCKYGAAPDASGSVCVCPILSADYAKQCVPATSDPLVYYNTTDGCPYDTESKEKCGKTYLFGKLSTPEYEIWKDTVRKQCVGGVCVCKEGYQLGVNGLCVALCDVNQTQRLVTSGSSVYCYCNGDYNSTAGCYTLLCQGRGIYHLTNNTCTCNSSLVFGGPSCGQTLCVNGSPSSDRTSCTCDLGYTGRLCDQRGCGANMDRRRADCSCKFPYVGNDCDSSVCKHGIPYLGGCNCSGTVYDTDIFCSGDACDGPGLERDASGNCVCASGWSGVNCMIFDCGPYGTFNSSSSTCVCDAQHDLALDGTCNLPSCPTGYVFFRNQSLCNCPEGYTASATEGCEPVCLNGGTNAADDTCLCPSGTAGTFCQSETTKDLPLLPDAQPDLDTPAVGTARRQSLLLQFDSGAPLDSAQVIFDVAELFNASVSRVSIYHTQATSANTQTVFMYLNVSANVSHVWANVGSKPCNLGVLSQLSGLRCEPSSSGLATGAIVGISVGSGITVLVLIGLAIKYF